MKVALYLTGHLRTYEQTWANWKKYVVDPLEADVFIATWPTMGKWISKGVPNKPDPLDLGTVQQDELLDVDKVYKLVAPKALHVIDEPSFAQALEQPLKEVCQWRDSLPDQQYWGYMPRSHVAQYCCWYAANVLRHKYEESNDVKYDVIIRARGDLLIEDEISHQYLELKNTLLTHIRNDIADPLWINDIMFISNPRVMDILCNLYNWYYPLFEQLKGINAPEWFFSSHKLIPYYLLELNTPWTEVELPFKRFNHSLVR